MQECCQLIAAGVHSQLLSKFRLARLSHRYRGLILPDFRKLCAFTLTAAPVD